VHERGESRALRLLDFSAAIEWIAEPYRAGRKRPPFANAYGCCTGPISGVRTGLASP
jgi:hypothetical protein